METVSSRQNACVRLLRQILREKQARDERGAFAVEGDHLCGELVSAGYEIKLFAYTEKSAAKYPETVARLKEKAKETIVITDELSEYISDTKSPQGMFAAASVRDWSENKFSTFGAFGAFGNDAKRVVVLDGVQDPGNVGTIIRTAEALGIDGAVLLNGCADILSPKTLRASMGSALRMRVLVADNAKALGELLPGFTLYAAMLDKGAGKLGEVKFPEKTAIVIGSEGGGVSDGIARICAEKLYIPIKKAESLNAAAAAAIILWEISKKKTE